LIYIPEIKQRIEELKPLWEKGKLSDEQYQEFCHLINEVVRESKRSRSSWLDRIPIDNLPENSLHGKDLLPEVFLLNLFKTRIENTVIKLFRRNKRLMKRCYDDIRTAGHSIDIKDTRTFKYWFNCASQIVRSLILTDSTDRYDRQKEVDRYPRWIFIYFKGAKLTQIVLFTA